MDVSKRIANKHFDETVVTTAQSNRHGLGKVAARLKRKLKRVSRRKEKKEAFLLA